MFFDTVAWQVLYIRRRARWGEMDHIAYTSAQLRFAQKAKNKWASIKQQRAAGKLKTALHHEHKKASNEAYNHYEAHNSKAKDAKYTHKYHDLHHEKNVANAKIHRLNAAKAKNDKENVFKFENKPYEQQRSAH